MQVRLLQNPKSEKGFTIHFPFKQEDVERIRMCLGAQWDKNLKTWRSEGPEILADFQRFGISIEWMSAEARMQAEAYRQSIWDTIDCRVLTTSNELFAYQQQGTDFLANLPSAILADDRGIGKSKQSIDAAAKIGADKILVLAAPKMVTENWPYEVQQWQPQYTAGIVPDDKKERKKFWENPPDVVIANFEKLRLNDWPFAIKWDVVIADELPRVAKNSRTLIHKSLKRVVPRATRFWILTGSPMEKRVMELYNVMTLIRPAVLGSPMRFKSQHIEEDWAGNVRSVKNLPLLQDRIAPYLLRRTKAEVLPFLPPKVTEKHFVRFSPREAAAYQKILMNFDPSKNWFDQTIENPLTQILRMRQFCCSPLSADPLLGVGTKFFTLKDILEDWEGKAVIFCYFKDPLRMLQQGLDLPPRCIVWGDNSARENMTRVQEFNEGKLGKILLSTDAGNMGVNITSANLIIHYDQLFNPQLMLQREDRLHRIGQTSKVTVINLMYLDSVDYGTYVQNRTEEKLFHSVVDGSEESILKKLDAPRLQKLVRGKLTE